MGVLAWLRRRLFPFYVREEWVEQDRTQAFRLVAAHEDVVLVESRDIVTYRHADSGEIRHTKRRRHFREWYLRDARETWPGFVDRAVSADGSWVLATDEELGDSPGSALMPDGSSRFRMAVMGETEKPATREVFE